MENSLRTFEDMYLCSSKSISIYLFRKTIDLQNSNSENLKNNWNMNWGQFNKPLCYLVFLALWYHLVSNGRGYGFETFSFYKKNLRNSVDSTEFI